MSQHRSPFRRPAGRRALVAAGLVAAVVLVPGVASADDNPLAPVTDGLSSVTGGLTSVTGGAGGSNPVTTILDGVPGGTGTGATPAAGLPIPLPGVTDGGGTGNGTTDPGSTLTPEALRALFIQALAPLGISADCVNGVFDGVGDVVDALTDSGPADLQNLLQTLVGALQSGGQGLDPSALTDTALAQALQELASTLQETCMPALPSGMPAPPSTGGAAYTPPAAAPVAAAPVAAPVAQATGSYLGYAPTGGTPAGSSNPVPLAVLGGFALLSVLGAAGYRVMSIRGARSR